MISIWFEFQGFREFIDDLKRTRATLNAGFMAPLTQTRDALRQAIDELFRSRGQSTSAGSAKDPWAPWSAFTVAARAFAMAGGMPGQTFQYMGRTARLAYYMGQPVEDLIGVWFNELREAFTRDRSPGFSEVTDEHMTMGLDPFSAAGDYKYYVFVMGRSFGGGNEQPPRAVFENLMYEDVATGIFTAWLRTNVRLWQLAEDQAVAAMMRI